MNDKTPKGDGNKNNRLSIQMIYVMNDKTSKGDELLQQNQLHNLRRK